MCVCVCVCVCVSVHASYHMCLCAHVVVVQVDRYACLCMFSDKKVLLWYMSVLVSVHCLAYLSMVYMYMAAACSCSLRKWRVFKLFIISQADNTASVCPSSSHVVAVTW